MILNYLKIIYPVEEENELTPIVEQNIEEIDQPGLKDFTHIITNENTKKGEMESQQKKSITIPFIKNEPLVKENKNSF